MAYPLKLPNGRVVQVPVLPPKGTPPEEVMAKLISKGLATEEDFNVHDMPIGANKPIEEQPETGIALSRGGIDGDKKALVGFMTTLDPQARMDIIKSNIPDAEFSQEGDVTYVDLPFQGRKLRTVLNRPGLSGQDVQDTVGLMLQYMPTSGWVSAGKNLMTRFARAAAQGIGTETARQVGSVVGGSEQGINKREIAQAGAENVIGQGLGEAVGKGIEFGAKAAKGVVEGALPMVGIKTPAVVASTAGTQVPLAAEKSVRAAGKLADTYGEGFALTPAEATGSPILAQFQGRRGISEAGEAKLTKFQDERRQAEKAIINKFLETLSPAGTPAARKARAASKNIIEGTKATRAAIAGPFYQEAYKNSIDDQVMASLMQDPIIMDAAAKVANSPVWQKELKGTPLNSVKYMHAVKQAMDDIREGAPSKEARIIKQSIGELNDRIADVSPDYKTANKIYSSLSKNVEGVEESTIGALSKLDDVELKKVSQMVFDPAQTDTQFRKKLFSDLNNEDPTVVKSLIRAEMERRLGNIKGERTGSNFYNTLLAKDKDFDMFLEASKGNPDVRRNLIWMRRSFENLIGKEGAKGAAFRAKSSLDMPRSSTQFIMDKINDMAGGKYDEAAIEIITNPKWADEVKAVFKEGSKEQQAQKLLPLLSKVATQQLSQSERENK